MGIQNTQCTNGRNLSLTTIIGYFSSQDEARKALNQLARQGFRSTVLIQKNPEGFTQTVDQFARRRSFWTFLAAILSAAFSGITIYFLHWLQLLPAWTIASRLVLILACGAIGGVAVIAFFRRERYGVKLSIILNHTRWLVAQESVLILRAQLDMLSLPMKILQESGDIPPALFALHLNRENRLENRGTDKKLSPTQVQQRARFLAGEQQVDKGSSSNTNLLKRLKQLRKWLRQVCDDLAAARRLEQKATPAADWILDNEYILEGNGRDVLLNLPRRFYQQLPSLASGPYQGLPRVYGVAKNLAAHLDLYLDRENISAYLDAYQSVQTLTIGELWAIPQMLRIALIESIQGLAATALADLRDRQLADFWANRLIAANRRDANQLFALLSELAISEQNPSPYFGGAVAWPAL
jgi:cyclic beta-1,2-glucan synthetase